MKNTFQKIKEYYGLHPKRFWIVGGVVVVAILYAILHTAPSSVTVIPVTQGDLRQTILATGQVTAKTDLNLSFSSSGLVQSLPVSVGDKVYQGQVLATLRNNNEYAALKLAQANYQKVADGSSSEEIAVAQVSLDNTRKVQDTLVENARRELLNSDLTPVVSSGSSTTAPTVTGFYVGEEGTYLITTYQTGDGGYFSYSGIENGSGPVSTTKPIALGTKGLYIQYPVGYTVGQQSSILLPNVQSSNYLSAYSAYQSALKDRDSAIASAEANLNLKKASARPADLAAAQASIDQAQATYENTILRAPASGTVTHVDTKIGERVDSQKAVVAIQDIGNLYIEANINETNISKVAEGQEVSMTLDAFGPEVYFKGSVMHIDPSSTSADGVVNYVIKVSVLNTSDSPYVIRPGMNANMTILAWVHPNVLSIPKAAIDVRDDGSYVRVVVDEKKKTLEDRKVTTGSLGDGNMIEVTSGISAGEKVAVDKK
jgi:HlyD family secretion protein